MAQILYTPIGEMEKEIDIWDQPPAPNLDGTAQDPVIFASGVRAKIEYLESTAQARKLAQQVLSDTTHKIVMQYLPGLKKRMFIIYADPDFIPIGVEQWEQGRRFEIENIGDPDERKRELRILAIERNDGQ